MAGWTDLFFVVICHNVSLIGKIWWILMLVLRSMVLLLVGVTLFSDERERFACNTIQPGCSNVCFDVFSPVSVLRLWILHLVLLSLPHLVFTTYVVHNILSHPYFEGSCCSPEGLTLANSTSSRLLSWHKTALCCHSTPRFHCAYLLVVLLRILLETMFSAGQFVLIGATVPKSFFCHEAPCTSGVECYISRPTEKTLMLGFMLGVAATSVLLCLLDLLGCVKKMMSPGKRKAVLMEEMSKGERSSTFTSTTLAEDIDVLLSSKINGFGDEKHSDEIMKVNSGPSPTRSPTPRSSTPTPQVLHGRIRPLLSSSLERGTSANYKGQTLAGVKKSSQSPSKEINSEQQNTGSTEGPDKRAWV